MKLNKVMLPCFVAACFITVILIATKLSECHKNEMINIGIFIATVSLSVIAYIQLNALREQSNADFLINFNREFFSNETNQRMIIAIEENKNILKINNGEFTEYQLDDYLGYYELMSWYEKRGFIDFELLDEMFGHYISLAWKNEEIKKYINGLRSETKDSRYYEPFEKLAIRTIEKEKEIRSATK